MAKNTQAKILTYDAHAGEREVHRRYGLRITLACSRMAFKSRSELKPRRYKFYCLSHLLAGNGWYWTPDSGKRRIKPGNLLVVTPGFIMDYQSDDGDYVEDFVCFTGSVADHLKRCGVIRDGIWEIGSRRLSQIIEMANDLTDDAQMEANLLLQNFLFDIYKKNKSTRSENHAEKISRLLRVIGERLDHWWTVTEMASFCEMSVNHFRDQFKSATGIPPKSYTERLRIQAAAQKLLKHDLSVAEIAEQLGYIDPLHFSKVFKKITGKSPTNYRSNFS